VQKLFTFEMCSIKINFAILSNISTFAEVNTSLFQRQLLIEEL
jgi:hypothetical protein